MTRKKLAILCLSLGVLTAGAAALALQDQKKKKPQQRRGRQIVPAAKLTVVSGDRLSTGETYDNQPAAAVTADGTTWVAWVRYENRKADEVVALPLKEGKKSKPVVLTAQPGQYIRPALAAAGDEVWCVWTRTEAENLASVWYSRKTADGWSPPARVAPGETRSHQNPEIAATKEGRVAVAYQVHTGSAYDIHLRTWKDGRADTRALSDRTSNDWDPSVAYDAKGRLHVVWSGFRDGDYDIYWKRLPGEGFARRITSRGAYDLHPWLTAAPDGTVWASWDVVKIAAHCSSGRTTITGANLKPGVDQTHGRAGGLRAVAVRVLDGDTVRVPGDPEKEIKAPRGYQIAHCGLAKVGLGPKGDPWIFYRVLRRDRGGWLPNRGISYWWELLARPLRDGRWAEPVIFESGDGYLEEAGLAAGPDGLRVAFGGERRDGSFARMQKQPQNSSVDPNNHHHDFAGKAGCNGEIYVLTLDGSAGKGPVAAELPAAPPLEDAAVANRDRSKPYEVTVKGTTYRLLWGDTHRHSNVSRCSAGAEPSPDDLYRYGSDVCRYDFFALSDHAEHHQLTRDDAGFYFWWQQQKLADLYHIPQYMSVLYNFEWTMNYPHGHHNTIFPSRPTIRLDKSLGMSGTLAGGWRLLEKNDLRALTIPHTGADPGMGTAWEIQDDRYQRLCEIFQSCRGSYEHDGCPREFRNTRNKKGFYWNALEKGYHVGVIASSDHGYGVAYACVYAPENTRGAIWQAMWDRRTYGSTTYGLVVDVRSGDRWMGEEWTSKEAPKLDIYVRGSVPIRSVEVLGRSKVLFSEGSVEKPINTIEKRISWSDPDWAAQTKEQWYYVRVIQTDDEIAWSSPVWVTPSR